MDKSVDSIGSCSLDVDADSSEKSDTSGSLNFPTPISIKDITRDFVANINERCPVRKIETTATLMNNSSSSSQAQTISTQPTCAPALASSSALPSSIATEVGNDKKPSYLNLACCVNGYSNITTYDSKIRQDINKSREVSPIRPSTSSIQYCKKNDFLAPPKLQKMPNPSPLETSNANGGYENGNGHQHGEVDGTVEVKNTSFIQQQMERLYGPAALAQGFYSPKKVRTSTAKQRFDNGQTSELKAKFKELSPSKDYSEFRRKINGTGSQTARTTVVESNPDNNNIDLPVLRHLSHEFRAQLPKISPKRNLLRTPPSEDENASLSLNVMKQNVRKNGNQLLDEVDHKSIVVDVGPDTNLIESVHALSVTNKPREPTTDTLKSAENSDVIIIEANHHEKDGHYFIKILKTEEKRLLALATVAEKYLDELSNQPEIGEEVLGLLRSASGKARLLVSQKMKQFEGLCHKNLNYTPGEVCRTTADDLQGFWDMVYLQVDDINAIFAGVEKLKENNWKLDKTTSEPQMSPRKQTKISNVAAANGSSKAVKTKSAAALERESQRKQKLLEMKRQKKLELAAAAANAGGDEKPAAAAVAVTAENPIEIFINENKS